MRQQVLPILPFDEPSDVLQRWREKFPTLNIVWKQLQYVVTTFGEIDKVADDVYENATILCTLSSLPNPSQVPKLKWIQLLSAGVDHTLQHPMVTETNVRITTSSGIHTPQMVEWVILKILATFHYFQLTTLWQQQKRWGTHKELQKTGGFSFDIIGKRVGILGYGSIGRRVARLCHGMGMEVVAFTASPCPTPESRRDNGFIIPGTGDQEGTIPKLWFSGLDMTSIHDFLSQDLDVLVLTTPLTEQTRQLLRQEEFEVLGKARSPGDWPGTLLLNVSRGQIIDQTALVAALKKSVSDGGLRAAALDELSLSHCLVIMSCGLSQM